MSIAEDPKPSKIDQHIKENLQEVYAELEADEMPDQITDLLMVLRAQDQERQDKK